MKYRQVQAVLMSLMLASVCSSGGLIAFADNQSSSTLVEHVGEFNGQEYYEVIVPAELSPGGESGEVKLKGIWKSTSIVEVTAPESIEMSNDIDDATADAIVNFEDIRQVGNNNEEIEVIKEIGVDDLEGALLGEWTGTIYYTVTILDAATGEDVHIHNWDREFTVDKEATCTEEGSKSIHCKDCDAVKDVTPIPKEDHNYVDNYCTECGEAEHIHDYLEIGRENPSCTEEGSVTEQCNGCGDIKTTPIEKLEHNFSEETDICEDCGILNPEHQHNYSKEISRTEGECETPGSVTKECICGVTQTSELPAPGHNYLEETDKCEGCEQLNPEHQHDYEEVVIKEVACGQPGETQYECKCGDIQPGRTIPSEHAFVETGREIATCQKDGLILRKCECGEVEIETIPKGQHAWRDISESVSMSWVNTSNGSYKFTQSGNTWTSNNYNVSSSTATSTWTITLDKAESVTIGYKVSSESSYDKFSITLDGTTIVNAISGAGSQLSYTKTLSAGTHTLKATYTKDSSVNKNDDRAYVYLNPVTREINKHKCIGCGIEENHSDTSFIAKQPTCTDAGIQVTECSVCNRITSSSVPANGHDYTGVTGVVTKEPTCTETGTKELECNNCDYVKQDVIPANGHDYTGVTGIVTKEPTCTGTGTKEFECTICDYIRKDTIPANGHDYTGVTGVVTQEPTCTVAGIKSFECNDCDYVRQDSIAKLGHVDSNKDKKCDNCSGTMSTTEFELTSSNYSQAGISRSGSVVIPSEFYYNGQWYKITEIGSSAFKGTSITSVTIPASVTYIGSEAFKDCSSLSTIRLNSKTCSFGSNCFYTGKKGAVAVWFSDKDTVSNYGTVIYTANSTVKNALRSGLDYIEASTVGHWYQNSYFRQFYESSSTGKITCYTYVQ